MKGIYDGTNYALTSGTLLEGYKKSKMKKYKILGIKIINKMYSFIFNILEKGRGANFRFILGVKIVRYSDIVKIY